MIGPDGNSGTPRDDAATRTTVLRTMSPHARDSLVLDLDDPQQRRLGDYELLERIGEGGMGVVYRARQVSLDRPVAVKLLDSGRRSSQEFLARFRLEAQSAARMQHPNIVTIHEIGATDRFAYFSMQLIEGCTLADVVAREGPLDPLAATRVLRTLAEAVEYAHELGVLHLDLKPANVLRDAGGRLYIADFGLARPLDHAVAAADDEISGTPAYMAPEQILIHQHRLTRATDIYGLGAILFELLTGRPPFRAGSAEATLERVLAEPAPSPRETRPKVSRDLEAICAKCLAKDPVARYASARALAEDLGRFLDGHPISIRRPTAIEAFRRWSKKNPVSFGGLFGAAALMLGGLATLGYVWKRQEAEKQAITDIAADQARLLVRDDLDGRQRVQHALRLDLVPERDHFERIEQDFARRQLLELYQLSGAPEAARDARLAHAFSQSLPHWQAALAARDSAASRMVLAVLGPLDEPDSTDGDELVAHVLRTLDYWKEAADRAPDAPAYVAAYLEQCRLVGLWTGSERCAPETAERLLALDPGNVAAFAVAEPLVLHGGSTDRRFAAAFAAWKVHPPVLRSYAPRLAADMYSELRAVAPQVLAASGARDVSADALAGMLLMHLTGYLAAAPGVLDPNYFSGLSAPCRASAAPAEATLAICRQLREAMVAGARDVAEQDAIVELRLALGDTVDRVEPRRIRAWQRTHRHRVAEILFEDDQRFLTIALEHGYPAARADLYSRLGIPLLPPDGWLPPP